MSKELLLVVDAVANEKGVPKDVIFDAMEAALASAAKKRYPDEDVAVRVAIDRDTGDYETFRRWEVVADDVVMESPDRQIRLMDAVDEKPEHRGRRLHRGADREPRIRPHRGAGRQAGHRAARARGRARAGRRCVQGSRRRTGHRHRQARRARQHLSRPRRQRRSVHPARQRDPARSGARRRPRARLPVRSARRAARPAAVRVAHRARIHDGAVQARSAGSRPGPGRDQGAARAIRATAPRSRCSRTTTAPIRSAPASACAVRACRRCRTN